MFCNNDSGVAVTSLARFAASWQPADRPSENERRTWSSIALHSFDQRSSHVNAAANIDVDVCLGSPVCWTTTTKRRSSRPNRSRPGGLYITAQISWIEPLALWSGGEVVRGRLDERGRAILPPVPLEQCRTHPGRPCRHAADRTTLLRQRRCWRSSWAPTARGLCWGSARVGFERRRPQPRSV
jgi:hypothetical protein